MATALLGHFGRWRLTRPVAERIRATESSGAITPEQKKTVTDGLVRIVNEVRERAPQARVVLVDYLPVFTDSTATGTRVPLTTAEIGHFRGVAEDLSGVRRGEPSDRCRSRACLRL